MTKQDDKTATVCQTQYQVSIATVLNPGQCRYANVHALQCLCIMPSRQQASRVYIDIELGAQLAV
jgi:hypothetical protein